MLFAAADVRRWAIASFSMSPVKGGGLWFSGGKWGRDGKGQGSAFNKTYERPLI